MVTQSELKELRKQKEKLLNLIREKKKVSLIKQRAVNQELKLERDKMRLKAELSALKRQASGRRTIKERLSTPTAQRRIKKGKKAMKTINKYLKKFAEA